MIRKAADIVAEAKSQCRSISAEEANRLREDNSRARVLDVREPTEVAESAVDGATNIPRGMLEMKIEQEVPAQDTPLMVCCATGGRAALAARTLQDMGYSDVRVIDCPHAEIAAAFNR